MGKPNKRTANARKAAKASHDSRKTRSTNKKKGRKTAFGGASGASFFALPDPILEPKRISRPPTIYSPQFTPRSSKRVVPIPLRPVAKLKFAVQGLSHPLTPNRSD